jgi:signal transduction histidine kinase
LLVYLHNLAGLSYRQNGALAAAIFHFLKAKQIIQQYHLDNSPYTVQTYNNLGGVWADLGEWRQAVQVLDLAEKHIGKEIKESFRAYVLINKGLAYWESDTSAALRNFREALDIVRKEGDGYAMHTVLINMSSLYLEAGRYPEAFRFLHEAAVADSALGSDMVRAQTQLQAGQVYFKTQDYPEALRHLTAALTLAEKTEARPVAADIHKALSEVYAATGRYKDAFFHQQQRLAYLDSLQFRERDRTVDLALKYQAVEKDKEIMEKLLQLNARESMLQRKNIWIGAVASGAALLLLVLVQTIRNSRNRRKLAQERMQNYVRQQELERLKAMAEGEEKERSRIAYDLHDGVMVRFATVKMGLNTLPEVVPQLRETTGFHQLLRQFDLATSELRRTAHNLMPDVLLEEGLAQALFYFCRSVEEATGLHIVFQQYGTLPRFRQDFEVSIYRIVQELIQNIVKHARATEAVVQLSYEDGLLSLTIEDNGRGFDPATASGGMGLAGVRNRLKIFGGIFDIQSANGSGTTIFFECETKDLIL